MRKIYYKATREDMVSCYDPLFVYQKGMNIHPNPDRTHGQSCGVGIHLAKTIDAAFELSSGATELYRAKAGVILGEDEKKVRCASCVILTRIHGIAKARNRQREKIEQEIRLGNIYITGGLPGKHWLNRNISSVSQSDIDNCRLEVITDKRKFSLGLNMKKKDRKFILREALA